MAGFNHLRFPGSAPQAFEGTPNPPWAANEPREDGGRRRCLSCRTAIRRSGLCAGPACFFAFWSKRLQHQQGRWLVRDIPRKWDNDFFLDNAWGPPGGYWD